MKTTLIAALLCTGSLLLPCAYAQRSAADTNQLTNLRAQAQKGDAQSQFELGVAFSLGEFGVAQDYVEAVKWFRQAAEQGHAAAQNNLGMSYQLGNGGMPKDAAEAVKCFRKAADQGYAPAQFNLGCSYEAGEGVPKDYAEAMKWFLKAADQGDAPAQYNIGGMYAAAEGVPKDLSQAMEWWRKAADRNHAKAQDNLGRIYMRGDGVPKDVVEAYKWCLLAAAQGYTPAKQNVAILEGQLTRVQLAEGQKRASDFKPSAAPALDAHLGAANGQPLADLRARAEAGDAKAQNELGEVLFAGRQGVRKDAVEAVEWFRQAANQNFAAAQSNLGVCYERGDGVAKYELEAYKWDLLAAAQGDVKAKRNTTVLELLLSPEELADGKRRAQAWIEQHVTPSTNN